jgi:hypothetical protein
MRRARLGPHHTNTANPATRPLVHTQARSALQAPSIRAASLAATTNHRVEEHLQGESLLHPSLYTPPFPLYLLALLSIVLLALLSTS